MCVGGWWGGGLVLKIYAEMRKTSLTIDQGCPERSPLRLAMVIWTIWLNSANEKGYTMTGVVVSPSQWSEELRR